MGHLSQVIRASLEAAYHNPDLRMEDIIRILVPVREEYQIDKIFLYSNREYRYQLSHVLTCSAEGIEVRKPITFMLTKEEYLERLKMYSENPVLVSPFQRLEQEFGGCFLNSGIMRDGEYFGTITFWCEKQKNWSEEEKKILLELRHLCLLFFGMNNLVYGLNPYEQSKREFMNDQILSGFFVNMLNGKCRAMKLAHYLREELPEWADFDSLIELYTSKYVDPVYGKQLRENFSFAALTEKLTEIHPEQIMEFPRMLDGSITWIRFMVHCNSFTPEGRPCTAAATFWDITEDVKHNAYLFGTTNINRNTYAVICSLELNSERYATYVDNRSKNTILKEYKAYGDYGELKTALLKQIIAPEYAYQFEKLFGTDKLLERFDKSDETVSCDIPCLIGGGTYWVRLEAVKTQEYNPENRKILLYCSDISEQKARELYLEKSRKTLEKENRQKKYQLEHDPLTGVYNRRGYDEILKQCRDDNRPFAYIQIDVDNFKTLNDTYGHAFGDEVLREVAAQLTDAFRTDDYVFRFGGDEFAVLLTNCRMDAWNSISYKQRMIHIRMNQALNKDIYVTLSMGVSWSDSGFTDDMTALADAALYRTKSNGRAGCCVLNTEHKPAFEWRDDIGNNTEVNPLAQSYIGACRIELPAGDIAKGRLICNETSRVLMGFAESMTPEECFRTWLDRIDSSSRETIARTRETLLEKGQAECTYRYRHPIQGQIMVRSGGRCLSSEEGITFYGYHQSLQDTRIVMQEDDSHKLTEAMHGLYFASYYISLKEDWFCIFRSTAESRHLEKQDTPASVNIQHFVQSLVKPEYREEMSRFVDLKTLAERLQDRRFVEAEYESVVEDKGWCRIRLLAVRRDSDGTATHVQLLIASIDQEKREQLEQDRAAAEALKLQLRVGEIVSGTKIQSVGILDRKTGDMKLYMNGIVSRDAMHFAFDTMKQWGLENVYPADRALFEEKFDMAYIEKQIQAVGSYNITFRQTEGENAVKTLIHYYEVFEPDPSKLLVVIENVTK